MPKKSGIRVVKNEKVEAILTILTIGWLQKVKDGS